MSCLDTTNNPDWADAFMQDPNPYAPSNKSELVDQTSLDLIGAETAVREPVDCPSTQNAQAKHGKRIWTVFVMVVLSWMSFMLASVVAVGLAYASVRGVGDQFNPRELANPQTMSEISASRIGFLIMVIPPQVALVLPCLVAALCSPIEFGRRLSIGKGHWPLWAWCAAAVTTPLVGWISSVIVGSLMSESENLKMMSDIFRGHGESGFLLPLAFLIGATPAFCEELVFRGYVQTRLNRRLGPLLGIGCSSSLFAVFHYDLVHIIAVFPLGVYLGVICWRSGSIIPAMLAHFVNNTISVFAVVMGPEEVDQDPSSELTFFLLSVIAIGIVGSLFTALAIWRFPGSSQGAQATDSPVAEQPVAETPEVC